MYSASTPFLKVNIDENDVPGAKLKYVDIEANNSIELRRYLDCRNQETKGKKKDLIARVKHCMQNKIDVNPYIDSGKWLAMKEKKVRKPLVEKHFIPFPLTWMKFPHNKIPENFNYGCIYNHLITTCVLQEKPTQFSTNIFSAAGDKENNSNVDYSTSKSLKRGKQYFDSGHVQSIVDALTDGKENHYCCKAHVLASYKQQHYNVHIMLHNETASVVDAKCHCKASTMGRCSHVAALLYALLDFVMTVQSSNACTSKPCEWNRPYEIELHKYRKKYYKNNYTNTTALLQVYV